LNDTAFCVIWGVSLCTVSGVIVLDYTTNYNVPHKKFLPSCYNETLFSIRFYYVKALWCKTTWLKSM